MIFPKFYGVKLKEKRHEAGDVYSFIFESEKRVEWIAGQHFVWVLRHENADDRGSVRIFTVSSAPHENNLMITTRYFGEKSSTFKRALMNLPLGGELKAFGPSPFKDRYRIKDTARPHIMVMGGIGVTPARSVLADLDNKGKRIEGKMLYANETDRFAFREELDRIASRMPDFYIEYITAPARIEKDDFRKTRSEYKNAINYISGPPGFVKAMKKHLKELGYKRDEVRYDSFVLSFLGIVLQKGYN